MASIEFSIYRGNNISNFMYRLFFNLEVKLSPFPPVKFYITVGGSSRNKSFIDLFFHKKPLSRNMVLNSIYDIFTEADSVCVDRICYNKVSPLVLLNKYSKKLSNLEYDGEILEGLKEILTKKVGRLNKEEKFLYDNLVIGKCQVN